MTSHRRAAVLKWNELERDVPMALLSRQRVIGENTMISRVVLQKGCYVPTHAHENEQFACVLSGRLKFGLGAEGHSDRHEVIAVAGDVVVLPPNVPHSAEALEETTVLDVFSPPSEKTGVDSD